MKKILAVALTVLALSACKDPKDDEKKLMNDVIQLHDKVMGNDELLMRNKMKIDTVLKSTTDATKKTQAQTLSTQLVAADAGMESWMQKFDAEQKGKSHDEIMAYLAEQKTRIKAIDSTINIAVKQSTDYLTALKK